MIYLRENIRYAINPARDLGPRLMTAMVGYGSQVFTFRKYSIAVANMFLFSFHHSQYWLWCPVIAPYLGALTGAGFYDVFLFIGKESIVNKP